MFEVNALIECAVQAPGDHCVHLLEMTQQASIASYTVHNKITLYAAQELDFHVPLSRNKLNKAAKAMPSCLPISQYPSGVLQNSTAESESSLLSAEPEQGLASLPA